MKFLAALWFLAQMGFGTADISATAESTKTNISGVEEAAFNFAEVRDQVTDYVADFELNGEAVAGEAIVAFTLSENLEIEVLDVITNDEVLEAHIRESLHGKEVQTGQFIAGMPFSLKMKFLEK